MEIISNYQAESRLELRDIVYILDSDLNEHEALITGKSLRLLASDGNYISYVAFKMPITIYIVQRKQFEFKDSFIDDKSDLISYKVFSTKELMKEFKNQVITSKIEELNLKR